MLLTVGHSTRLLEEFLALLARHGVRTLVDVRRFPASRRHPWFNGEALAEALQKRGMRYVHEPDLGGRRGAPDPGSPNVAWRNESFRAYADHTATPAFQEALARVLAAAAEGPTAVMCAEAVPWRCHRRLISDVVVARGGPVGHIMGAGPPREHEVGPDVRVDEEGRVTWPGAPPEQTALFEEGDERASG